MPKTQKQGLQINVLFCYTKPIYLNIKAKQKNQATKSGISMKTKQSPLPNSISITSLQHFKVK